MCSLLVPSQRGSLNTRQGLTVGLPRGDIVITCTDMTLRETVQYTSRDAILPFHPAADLSSLSGRSSCCFCACLFSVSILTIRLHLVFAVHCKRMWAKFVFILMDHININVYSSQCSAEARVPSRARSCEICAEQSGTEADFNPNTRDIPCQYCSNNVPCSYFIHSQPTQYNFIN